MSSEDDEESLPPPLAQRLQKKRGGGAAGLLSSSSPSFPCSSSSSSKMKRPRLAALRPASPDAVLLGRLLQCSSSAAAGAFLRGRKGVTRAQRRRLAEIAGLEHAWARCNQAVKSNVADLADMIVDELYIPFAFYRQSLAGGDPAERPRALFLARRATRPLANKSWPWRKTGGNDAHTKSKRLKRGRGNSNEDGFWQARNGLTRHAWLPSCTSNDGEQEICALVTSFDSVVHFVQSGSGTGVHIGDGFVLTCAHVVDARDDISDVMPGSRLGREKVVVFPSERAFLTRCVSCVESADGLKDVAVMQILHEIPLWRSVPAALPPASRVSTNPVELGARIFCIGNPSNVDLESLNGGDCEFEPPTWHASVGECLGYVDPKIRSLLDAQRERGRAPTRGEVAQTSNPEPVGSAAGGYLQHSCWTYWGHSGAPIFNEEGCVVGIHCAWDDRTGMRHGQKLAHLQEAMSSVVAL